MKNICKEKTALVIPNAIEIITEGEKFFFTSFLARDRAFLMLFKLWQNALLDQVSSRIFSLFSNATTRMPVKSKRFGLVVEREL